MTSHRRRRLHGRSTDGLPQAARPPQRSSRPDAPVHLVGRQDHTDDPMTEDEALGILEGSCFAKRRRSTWAEADGVARAGTRTKGETIVAYACPFGSIRGGAHWHVGRPPTHEQVERIALAMRWLREHPEALVTPSDDEAV